MVRRIVMGVVIATIGLASVCDLRSYTLLIMLIACGALIEFQGLSEKIGGKCIAPIAFTASFAYLIFAMFGLLARYESLLLGFTILAALIWAMFGSQRGYLTRSAVTVFAVMYTGKLLSYFILLRSNPTIGIALTLFVIFVVACTDIFAMLVGKYAGRTKLSPISPAKTVEGAVGGLVAATLVGIAFAGCYPGYHLALWAGACLGFCTSVAAQTGDLVESALKRDALVKDAGTALMSHGGVLDRFDSYFFGGIAFSAMYFLLTRFPLELN